jgi:hypothetical protein
MVYVLPEPDWPYAITDISYPVTNELSLECVLEHYTWEAITLFFFTSLSPQFHYKTLLN